MQSHFKELVSWRSSHELRGETIEASKTLLCWEGSMKIDGPQKPPSGLTESLLI